MHISPMNNFHAHIYFDHNQKAIAELLVTKLVELNLPDLKLWKFHDRKVGPHALPMAEVHFTADHLKIVLNCLKFYNDRLSILIHEDSGDDFKDHENPTWLGPSLPIDFDFFQRVKAQPSLSVH